MAPRKKTPAPDTAERAIPLADITITWPPLNDYEGEVEQPIRLTGRALGQVLAWMARTSPGMLAAAVKDPDIDIWGSEYMFLEMQGIAGAVAALGEAGSNLDSQRPAICAFLASAARDAAARVAAKGDVQTDLAKATVTIRPPAPEAQ